MTLTSRGRACAAILLAAAAADVFLYRTAAVTAQSPYPEATISNGLIRATVYLPDAERGFYRSTRFDWSGVVASLEFQGHRYYGPWFTASDPPVRDFIYREGAIVTGAQSTMMGPAEEFQGAQGYAAASPGGTFVKIGVGVLRKVDEAAYSGYTTYPLVDAGHWSIVRGEDSVLFVQELEDPSSGYAYVYRKTLRLAHERPEMTIEHSLQNTGRLPIETRQYNHNFLVLDAAATGPDFVISAPFAIRTTRPPDAAFAEIIGNQIVYRKVLVDQDRVTFPIQGFGPDARDYDFRIENTRTGAGVQVTGDRPLASVALWSIRSVISVEPFVDVSTNVGATTNWTYTYKYF